jgi:dTDP-4-amino-4,6-dideoxygalactose transaminase
MNNTDAELQPVPVFDLKRQSGTLSIEIKQALDEVIGRGQFILGDNVRDVEEEIARLCQARYGIGVGNGSDALYLALEACGVGPGDEVITTPFTFFATAGSVARAGAVPVFVDIDPRTFNIDPLLIEGRITARTRAIIPVHLFGQPAAMDMIMDIAKAHGLMVIEDAAQAIGAGYSKKPVGGLGDAGCISFFPTKNLGCFGDGGMVVTDSPDLAERLRMLRVHGSRQKYRHELMGINSRLDEVQAAILKVKLPYLQDWIEKRRRWAGIYGELFNESGLVEQGRVVLPCQAPERRHVFNQYTIRLQDRDRLRAYLEEKGVGTSVYYPLPLHQQVVFKDLGYRAGDFPHAEQASLEVLSLPMFPELTPEEIARVVAEIKNYYADGR